MCKAGKRIKEQGKYGARKKVDGGMAEGNMNLTSRNLMSQGQLHEDTSKATPASWWPGFSALAAFLVASNVTPCSSSLIWGVADSLTP